MRDIRKDIRERLEAIESQREHLQMRLKRLVEKEAMLKTLLQEEETEWIAKQPTLLQMGENPPQKVRTELGKFIMTTLSDGNPHSLNDLVTLSQNLGIHIKGKSPRRAINFSLVGMRRNNLVERIERGVWKIHKNGGGEVSQ